MTEVIKVVDLKNIGSMNGKVIFMHKGSKHSVDYPSFLRTLKESGVEILLDFNKFRGLVFRSGYVEE